MIKISTLKPTKTTPNFHYFDILKNGESVGLVGFYCVEVDNPPTITFSRAAILTSDDLIKIAVEVENLHLSGCAV